MLRLFIINLFKKPRQSAYEKLLAEWPVNFIIYDYNRIKMKELN